MSTSEPNPEHEKAPPPEADVSNEPVRGRNHEEPHPATEDE